MHSLHLGDCLDILRGLESSSIDCVVTSPPYNQGIDKFKPSGMQKDWRWAEKIAAGYFDSMPEEQYQDWQVAILDELYRVVRDGGSVFYNHKLKWRDGNIVHPIDIVRRSKFNLRQEIIWRRDGSLTLNARMFAPCDERIYWLRKGRHAWNQSCVGYMSVWNINSEKTKIHACAFPVEIPRRCILATTQPDETVLDPFCGSGTTGVACAMEGRNFVGIDIDANNIGNSRTRIEQVQPALMEAI
jgi:site-specific DNA-methyltransferase (adenine-specific)